MQEILSHIKIEQKINRIAHQLLENTIGQETVFILGIEGNGFYFAEKLAEVMRLHSSEKIQVIKITINKEEPWNNEINLSCNQEELKNHFIILVDDVINSGKTMQYALTEILKFPTKSIKTATLVDRKHRRFPIKADFVGMSLSTTLKDRVEIDLISKEHKAWLV